MAAFGGPRLGARAPHTSFARALVTNVSYREPSDFVAARPSWELRCPRFAGGPGVLRTPELVPALPPAPQIIVTQIFIKMR